MDEADRSPTHRVSLPRCQACGDVIGVYEPLVIVDPRGARMTSLAAEPELDLDSFDYRHPSCPELSE